jgi:hypothetical protein
MSKDDRDMSMTSGMSQDMQQVIHEAESFTIEGGYPSENFFNALNEKQQDPVIEITQLNYQNHFELNRNIQRDQVELALAHLKEKSSSEKARRQMLLLLIGIMIAATLAVLFIKEHFFTHWTSFVAGLVGGYGFSKIPFLENDEKNG